jgi:hypothetical protein
MYGVTCLGASAPYGRGHQGQNDRAHILWQWTEGKLRIPNPPETTHSAYTRTLY